MKLSTKLGLTMASLLVMMMGLGAFSLIQMRGINAAATLTSDRWLPLIVLLEEMNTNLSDYRISEIQHVYNEDIKIKEYYKKQMEEKQKEFQEMSVQYEIKSRDPKAKELYSEFKPMLVNYFDLHNQIFDLSNELKTQEAALILNGKSRDIYNDMSSKLLEIVHIGTKGGQAAGVEANDRYQSSIYNVGIILILAVLCAVALTIYIVRNTMGQLGKDPAELNAIAQQVAEGELNLKADDKARGVFANILVMVANLKGHIENAQRESENARKESEKAREAMTQAQMAQEAADAKSKSILRAADKLEEVAHVLSSASAELAAQIEQSERGASEQAARVAETATAMEEMNSTVVEVARNAGQAAQVSTHTREKAVEGAKVVGEALQSIQKVQQNSEALKHDMSNLAAHAQSISQIMSVISDIADQTNLLALNAAIEAARAGDAGRGFAVVADEVRKLAEKTMASTTDVGNAIKAIQHSAGQSAAQVDATVDLIARSTQLSGRSGESLQEIVTMADSTADQVRAIAAASEEQSASSEEISRSIAQVNTIAAETSRAMEESARAVSDLAHQAQILTTLIEEMKRG